MSRHAGRCRRGGLVWVVRLASSSVFVVVVVVVVLLLDVLGHD